MQITDYFYTAQQAATVLNINRITIWRWMKSGKLTFQRVGNEVLIPKWEVDLIAETKARKNVKRDVSKP